MPHRCNLPIGMFDSGVGGLTVLQQLTKRLPQERIVYFGDTARLPYGEKSSKEVLRYSIENVEYLVRTHVVKMIVIACNTAAAHSSAHLKKYCPVPIVDVVESGVENVIKASKLQHMAVLGTRGTIRSGIYEEEIRKRSPKARVISIACPLLAPLVEEQFTNHESTRLIIREYLSPLKSQKIDALLLGCTHYPLIRPLIVAELGSGIEIIDSSTSCAEKVARLLGDLKLETKASDAVKSHQFFVSDDPERFSYTAKKFLGVEINVRIKDDSH